MAQSRRQLGLALAQCPECSGLLAYMGRDKETQLMEKQCIGCSLVFLKRLRKRWVMYSLSDPALFDFSLTK